MLSRPGTLAELPRSAAARFGDKVALISQGVSLSFRDVELYVAACAAGLRRLGVGPGDAVVLHLPNSWQWIVAYYSIARIGAVVVPANILLVSEEVHFIAQDSAAVALFAPGERIEGLRSEGGSLQYISVGPTGVQNVLYFDDLLRESPLLDLPSVESASISTIGYTSGTTGRSKGAVLSHSCVVINTAMTANMHVRTRHDTVVSALPCAHVYGNVVMNGAFLCGYTLVLLEKFDAEQVLESVERDRATLFEGVPTMYYYLLNSGLLGKYDIRSLTRVTVGGQTMPLPLMREIEERLACPILELWGMTEIAGLGTTHPAYAADKLGSIGQPLPFCECRIADTADPQRELEVSEVGELHFRGPTVMRGYLGRSEATREVLLPDGWLRTGDLAYRDSEGYLYIVDRLKEMIITAGYNIYPSEIERVIAAHPDVQMVAVGGTPDEAKGELAIAYVVLRPSASVDENGLMEHCRQGLAAYKVPRGIRFVNDLPKTSTGKIIRRALHNLPQQ